MQRLLLKFEVTPDRILIREDPSNGQALISLRFSSLEPVYSIVPRKALVITADISTRKISCNQKTGLLPTKPHLCCNNQITI